MIRTGSVFSIKTIRTLQQRRLVKIIRKAEEIKADNEIRMEWNRTVDRAIVSGVSDAEIVELKKAEITEKVKGIR